MSGRKETTFEQRQLVVFHHVKGKTIRNIAEILKMKRSTVGNIISRYKNEDRIDLKARSGRPCILTTREKRSILQNVKVNPRLSSSKLAEEVQQKYNKDVSAETVRSFLRKHGFHARVPRKKPFINELNRRRRIAFAKKYRNHSINFWKTVIFADESKFNIHGSDGRDLVWRQQNTELNPIYMRGTVKHGGAPLWFGAVCLILESEN